MVVSESESHSVMLDSLWPHGLYSPWTSPGQNTGMGSLFPSLGYLPDAGNEPRSPTWQADSLPAEPQRKPKNIGVGSLTLLQRIFLTQESNRGLLHHRQMLYQLSYQTPFIYGQSKLQLFWCLQIYRLLWAIMLILFSWGQSLELY